MTELSVATQSMIAEGVVSIIGRLFSVGSLSPVHGIDADGEN